MSLNSIKTLTLAMALFSIVACGKNKNNLNVDGLYQDEGTTLTFTKNEKTTESVFKQKGLTLVKIKDAILTRYIFSADKKSIEVSKEQLIIRGDKLIGTEAIEDFCNGESLAIGKDLEMNLNKSKGGLKISGSINGEDQAKLTMNLKSISEEEFATLTKDLSEGKLQRACLDENGKVTKKIDGDKVMDLLEEEEKVEESAMDNSSALTDSSALETADEDSI